MPERFINPMLLRYSDLSKVSGPAFFTAADRPGDIMFVTGGNEPFAIFLTGEWVGQGFPINQSGRWTGTAIEGIQVAVDMDSAFNPSIAGKRMLSIVRDEVGFAIQVEYKPSGSFTQRILVRLDGAQASSDPAMRIAFSRWRVLLPTDEKPLLIHEVDIGSGEPS